MSAAQIKGAEGVGEDAATSELRDALAGLRVAVPFAWEHRAEAEQMKGGVRAVARLFLAAERAGLLTSNDGESA
jgi:hypothetical protein